MRYVPLVVMVLVLAACQVHAQPAGEVENANPQAGDGGVEQWLEKVEARAAALKTLTARLRIAIINPLTGDEQVRFGRLAYDAGPPGRFSVHLDQLVIDGNRGEKMNTWYIFDGRWLLERNHDNKTAVRRQVVPPDVDASEADPLGLGKGPFPLPLRATKADILARFDVTMVEPCDEDPDNTVHLKLTPRDAAGSQATQMDLWYDRTTLLPVTASSLAEDETVVTLISPKLDEPVKDDTFDTALPTDQGWTTEVRPWEAPGSEKRH